MFALVPVFAGLVMLAYRKQGAHYPQYLYLSLHIHSVAFGFLILALPLQAFAPDIWITIAQLAALSISFVYFVLTL